MAQVTLARSAPVFGTALQFLVPRGECGPQVMGKAQDPYRIFSASIKININAFIAYVTYFNKVNLDLAWSENMGNWLCIFGAVGIRSGGR